MNFEPFALASANSCCTMPVQRLYHLRGSCRHPVRRSFVQALRHSLREQRNDGRRPFFYCRNFVFGPTSMNAAPEPSAVAVAAPRRPIREIVGTLGFGGPVALCGLMEKELVGERGWLTKEEMRDAIAVSQALPGPLAIQVGIFIAYLRGGFWGAWAGGWAFILPNFLIVAALGALYVHFGGLSWMTAVFYGVSPAVIALILHSCYRLAKLGMEDWLQWVVATACFVVTVWLPAEVAILFIGAGILGILYYGSPFRGGKEPTGILAFAPLAVGTIKAPTLGVLAQLSAFFVTAGSLTFGSGLVIVLFLEKGLVQQ